MDLDRIPLWSERRDISVDALWKAYCHFPYLPRLASFDVLAAAISDGISKIDWQNDTFAYADGHDGNRWVGLATARLVSARRSGYIVAPDAAMEQITSEAKPVEPAAGSGAASEGETAAPGDGTASRDGAEATAHGGAGNPTAFYGRFSLDSVRAIRQLEEILRNVVEHLSGAPAGSVELTLEINTKSDGYDERVRRVVSENAKQLGARSEEFE